MHSRPQSFVELSPETSSVAASVSNSSNPSASMDVASLLTTNECPSPTSPFPIVGAKDHELRDSSMSRSDTRTATSRAGSSALAAPPITMDLPDKLRADSFSTSAAPSPATNPTDEMALPIDSTLDVASIEDSDEEASLFGGGSSDEDSDEDIDFLDVDTELSRLKGIDTPPEMSCTLLPHQRIGLEWLLKHETSSMKGGILADDMGLGKTIQALALIFANPPRDPTRCKTTLIVAPLALLQQWPREINDKTKPAHRLDVYVFHGSGRSISHQELLSYDVVLSNYDTLMREFKRTEEVKDGLVLLHPDTHFHRVILDEAHNIKNRHALTSRGAFRLKADYRLCMSGTPLMNRPEELYAMLHFLDIEQYKEWDYFNKHVARPLQDQSFGGTMMSGLAMRRIHDLREKTMLARKKTDLLDGKPIITLPPRTDSLEFCILNEQELAFYTALEEQTEVEVQQFLKASKGDRIFSSMLVKLLRLRQSCCHPDLLATTRKQKESEDDLQDLDRETRAAIEALGEDSVADAFVPTPDYKPLPTPKSKTRSKAEKAAYYRELEEDYQPSAKIKKTLDILASIREQGPEEKIIVFSFFTSYLDILAIGLCRAEYPYKRYDGTLSATAKDAIISDFVNPNSETKILLTSLKSGNAGLNLNIANHVIIEEPYWNPFVEAQAVDRAHRIGQTKPVHVYRLLVKDTVEDRIVALQEKKSNLVALALSRGDGDANVRAQREKIGGLSKEDMLGLLRGGRPAGVSKEDVRDDLALFSPVTATPPTFGSSSNAGPSQAGLSQAGPSQAGPSEAGLSEAGLPRAGLPRVGSSQAGLAGAGPPQAGLATPSPSQTDLPTAIPPRKFGQPQRPPPPQSWIQPQSVIPAKRQAEDLNRSPASGLAAAKRPATDSSRFRSDASRNSSSSPHQRPSHPHPLTAQGSLQKQANGQSRPYLSQSLPQTPAQTSGRPVTYSGSPMGSSMGSSHGLAGRRTPTQPPTSSHGLAGRRAPSSSQSLYSTSSNSHPPYTSSPSTTPSPAQYGAASSPIDWNALMKKHGNGFRKW